LFASKKPAKAESPAAQPAEEEEPQLSVQDVSTEDEIPVMDLDLFSEDSADTYAFVLNAEDVVFDPNLDDALAEESVPVMDWDETAESELPAVELNEALEDEILALFTADEPAAELAEEEIIPAVEAAEEILPVFETAQEPPAAEPEADTDTLSEAEDSFDIHDILFELSDFHEEDDVKAYTPSVFDDVVIPEEEDIKVYLSEDAPAAESVADTQALETIVFDALDLSEDPAPAQPVETAPVQPKAPGFFAKAAAVVMGLFASKKPTKPAAPAVQPASSGTSEDDPFANLADLFAEKGMGELSGMDELMLELEMQVEREAELEAETAAREAAERLALQEEQKALELEAQRLAQAEADAQAEAQRRKAEEDARMKAETDALLKQLQAEEEERQALAEEELFEWIEAAEKRRETAAYGEAYAEDPIAPAVPVTPETTVILEAPVLEERPAQSDTPVYDYAAVELPAQSQEYAAPQMDISIEEEVPEEVGDLLEMPDVEQISPESEETPEEAAARKKKEEDKLHYKPEESTAKTVTSHIGKRFGAAFTAFTETSDDSDDEEDLGPELPASKAYRFFNKYISAYRFRLRVSAVLCVILGWISLGLPVFGSLKNPAAASAMCLMILLTVMLAGADILAVGVRGLLRKRPGVHSLVALSCLASVVDAIVIIVTKGTAGYLPFCGVSAISMCFAIYGSLLYCRSQRLNFKTLDRATEPMTISVDYGIVEEDTSTVYRSPGHPEGYIHHSEEEDLSETVFGIIAPILIPAVPVMTLIAALFSGGFSDFFHIMAAMFAAAASFGALIAFPLPYFLVQRDLYATKAAIAGWAGAREIGRVSTMIVTDRDLFPDDTVSIKSVRIVDNVPPQLTLSYMCSVIHRSGSCLVPAFTQLAENNDCELLDVENFQCHEAGGLSADIGPDSVLVASHSYMKLQGFRIPARKKDSENALFLAVNGHVIAYIIVDYKPIKSVRAGLQSALRGNVEMIFAARDFNVTPLLISKKFKSATETLRFPSYSQRYEITSHEDSETAACAAVVYRKSFYSYAVVVEKARYLYNSVSWGVILSAVSSLMGVLLMFIMAITGAGAAVTVSRLLVFMLLWLIPTLALTISITK